jgi:tetratricopeptide (TPR) repeat protein
MDPENPIVKCCVQGMDCESKGDFETASRLFLAAWEQSTDDFERCIAAHYVARHQKSPEEALIWNQRSLDHALAVKGETVCGFFPSLYLNLGKAFEDLARWDEARQFYDMAVDSLSSLPENIYSRNVRDGVERALERITSRTAPHSSKATRLQKSQP